MKDDVISLPRLLKYSTDNLEVLYLYTGELGIDLGTSAEEEFDHILKSTVKLFQPSAKLGQLNMRFRTTLTLVATSLLGGAALTAYTYENDQVPGHRPRYVRDLIANSENHFKTTMDSMNQRIQQKDAIITEKENAQKLKEQEEHDNQVKKQNIRDALHTMHPILKHGLPLGAEKQIICALDNAEAMPVNIAVFKKYISETDFAKKTPRWVANTIGAREPNNPDINRKNSYFKQDPGGSIPEPFQASNQDYWASGYHRGYVRHYIKTNH